MWEGSAESEVGREADTGILRVRVNPKFYRPAEVEFLQGDCSKAKSLFEWKPKYDFKVSEAVRFGNRSGVRPDIFCDIERDARRACFSSEALCL